MIAAHSPLRTHFPNRFIQRSVRIQVETILRANSGVECGVVLMVNTIHLAFLALVSLLF